MTQLIKPIDVKSSTYTDSSKEINDKDPKFKIADIFRIPKCKMFYKMLHSKLA